MVRAPCCEKMGLKRGPWTPQEDRILINYVSAYGHGNWRALPKQAGLLRCGKSCRLRWTNYLRPDIKRGNFSKEEEEMIIKLHEMLGNRWSAIAARLPGRTDNEIKNVWHTHLKKKLIIKENQKETKLSSPPIPAKIHFHDQESQPMNDQDLGQVTTRLESPQYSASETSSSSAAAASTTTTATTDSILNSTFHEMDENFWADVFAVDISDDFELSQLGGLESVCGYNSNMHDGVDYWFNLFSTAEEIPELPAGF